MKFFSVVNDNNEVNSINYLKLVLIFEVLVFFVMGGLIFLKREYPLVLLIVFELIGSAELLINVMKRNYTKVIRGALYRFHSRLTLLLLTIAFLIKESSAPFTFSLIAFSTSLYSVLYIKFLIYFKPELFQQNEVFFMSGSNTNE